MAAVIYENFADAFLNWVEENYMTPLNDNKRGSYDYDIISTLGDYFTKTDHEAINYGVIDSDFYFNRDARHTVSDKNRGFCNPPIPAASR